MKRSQIIDKEMEMVYDELVFDLEVTFCSLV